MSSAQRIPVVTPRLRRLARMLGIILAWSLAVAFGTACFFAPRGQEAQPTSSDLVGFATPLGLAGAVAAATAVGLAGRRRWAVEIALAVALMAGTTAVLASFALWVAPWSVRSRMDAWSFLRLRQDVLRWGEAIAVFHAPMAVGVGVVVGAIVGHLIILRRRWPRLGMGILLGLLLACAVEPVQQALLGAVTVWGWTIRRFSDTWPMTDDQVWATATVLGAIAGCVVAGFGIRLAHPHRPATVTEPGAEPSHRAGAGPPAAGQAVPRDRQGRSGQTA